MGSKRNRSVVTFMGVAVSRRHREHRSSIAVTSWRNRIVTHPRCSYASTTLLLRYVRSCYALCALATNNALPQRLCYLDIANIGASATLLLRSWRSGQLNAWFKCSPKVGVAILDSRTTSERFHAHVIEELRAIFQLVIVSKLYPSVYNHGQTQDRVALRLRLAWT